MTVSFHQSKMTAEIEIEIGKVAKVEVLKDCRKYLGYINVCNEGIFIKSIRIPDILINIILVAPMTYTTILLASFCYVHNLDLSIVALGFTICIGCTQITLIYFTLMFEKTLIFDTMNMIQNFVDYRKKRFFAFLNILNQLRKKYIMRKSKIEFFPGCKQSTAARKIYENAACENAILAKSLTKYVLLGFAVTYVPAVFIPLCYLVLGVPEPNNWVEPFPARFESH